MAPRAQGIGRDQLAELIREMGRLSEVTERGKEDRAEMRESFEKLDGNIEALRGGLNALNQTMQSMAHQVTTIGVEKWGERLDRIDAILSSDDARSVIPRIQKTEAQLAAVETKMANWERW